MRTWVLFAHLGATGLVAAGAAKILSPAASVKAFAALGVKRSSVAAGFGVAEITGGGAALLFGGRLAAALLALTYVGFALYLVWVRSRPDPTPCGCFAGDDGGRPTRLRIGIDLALATGSGIAAGSPVPGLASSLDHLGGAALPYLQYLALATVLLMLAETALEPSLRAVATFGRARRGG